ncbi:MAG: Ig-like domain-containing protein [Oscillospiraceae bacterium]|nr:Ig-like domain-containing protein [Oscillospiraceae bacterium]
MKKYGIRNFIAVLSALVLCLVFCTVSTSAASMYLNKYSMTLVTGTSYTLKVNNAVNKVTWSTSDSSVATVSSAGRVTALKKGTATIYATTGGFTFKCKVNVVNGYIKTEKTSVSLEAGDKGTLVFEVMGGTGKKMKCTNSDGDVLKIDVCRIYGDKVYVRVIGLEPGESYIKLYFENDKSVSRTIKVTVTGGIIIGDDENLYELGYADQLLYYINIQRVKNDLEPLMIVDDICDAAQIRASEISLDFSHMRPNGLNYKSALDEVNCPYYKTGELISGGTIGAKDVVDYWMSFEGYAVKILDENFRRMGAARVYAPDSLYEYYWVVIFDGV